MEEDIARFTPSGGSPEYTVSAEIKSQEEDIIMEENTIHTASPEFDPENNTGVTETVPAEDMTQEEMPAEDNATPEGGEQNTESAEGAGEDKTEAADKAPAAGEGDAEAAPEPRPARRRRTPRTVADDSGITTSSAETDPEAPVSAVRAQPPAGERQRQSAQRRRALSQKLRMEAPLDAEGHPVVDGDGTFDSALAGMYQKRSNREIVNGYIGDVKVGRNGGEGWVEVPYEDFRVLIPFSELDISFSAREEGENNERYATRQARSVANMVGARIEFVITSVDGEERIATGSRLRATQARRRFILNGKERDGSYTLYEGRTVSAAVLSVSREFAFLDIYGMRVRVGARDISADYIANIGDILEVGMSIDVKISSIRRAEDGDLKEMSVTLRDDAAEQRKLQNAAASIREGDICRARVTRLTRERVFFVLNSGLQGYSYLSNGLQSRRIPDRGDDVSVRVIRMVTNSRNGNPFVYGAVVRNLSHNVR